MARRLVVLTALVSVFVTAAPDASAAPARRTRTRGTRIAQTNTQRQRTRRRPDERQRLELERERTMARRYLERRTISRRKAAAFFEKVAVKRDYRGEYVLERTPKVTAFLDLSDPHHPAYDPQRESPDEELMAHIPPQKRVHILVVPNTPREHIGRRLGSIIGRSDLEATLEVVKAAESLAAKLKVKNPRVFVNSESNIGVGYLHVHIIGERGSNTSYPQPLK